MVLLGVGCGGCARAVQEPVELRFEAVVVLRHLVHFRGVFSSNLINYQRLVSFYMILFFVLTLYLK